MCLKVAANGNGDGAGTHVSMFVSLMRGEHDDKLTWPFRGVLTIQLVNQNRDQDHLVRILDLGDKHATTDDKLSGRVTSGEIAEKARGFAKFFPHSMLESTAGTKQYLKKDCIKFEVNKVVLH